MGKLAVSGLKIPPTGFNRLWDVGLGRGMELAVVPTMYLNTAGRNHTAEVL